jgi:hypothetical protein
VLTLHRSAKQSQYKMEIGVLVLLFKNFDSLYVWKYWCDLNSVSWTFFSEETWFWGMQKSGYTVA